MEIISAKIENIPVALTVEETITGFGGYPILTIGETKVTVMDVDTLTVIKAIATSGKVCEFVERIGDEETGIWNYARINNVIKSYALDKIDADDFCDVLCNGDEWARRKMNTLSKKLRETDPKYDEWYELRAMMYDTVVGELDE